MWNILSVQYNGSSSIIGLDFHEKLKNAKKIQWLELTFLLGQLLQNDRFSYNGASVRG
jgi:hypothetical protein